MRRVLCIVGIVALFATAAWADVYRCQDNRGKIMFQDQPCADASAEPLLYTQPPSPLSVGPTVGIPGNVLTPLVPTEPTDELTAKECMTLQDIKTQEGKNRRAYYTELQWQVQVSNRCRRVFNVWVRYALHDKAGFEIDRDIEKLIVPSREIGTATGRMLVSPEKMRRYVRSEAFITFHAND